MFSARLYLSLEAPDNTQYNIEYWWIDDIIRMPLTSKFKKVASRKKTGATSSFSGSKSADELDTPLDVDLAVANGRVLKLEKELSECKAELQASMESAVLNNEEAAKLRSENTDLKNMINQLQGENSDMKKVFGTLDDLGDLRNQYEKLFEDDFKASTDKIDVDIATNNNNNSNNPAASDERREKTRVFCDELKSFILDTRTNNSLGGQ